MNCTSCGALVKDDSRYCSYCGSVILATDVSAKNVEALIKTSEALQLEATEAVNRQAAVLASTEKILGQMNVNLTGEDFTTLNHDFLILYAQLTDGSKIYARLASHRDYDYDKLEMSFSSSSNDRLIGVSEFRRIFSSGNILKFYPSLCKCDQCGSEFHMTRNFSEGEDDNLEVIECPVCDLRVIAQSLRDDMAQIKSQNDQYRVFMEHLQGRLQSPFTFNKGAVENDIRSAQNLLNNGSVYEQYYEQLLSNIEKNTDNILKIIRVPVGSYAEYLQWRGFRSQYNDFS